MRTLIAIGVGMALYAIVVLVLYRHSVLPSWIRVSGPLTLFETQRVPAMIDRLASHRRFWRRVTDGGVVVSGILLVLSMGLVVLAGYLAATRDVASEVNRPRNAIAVPGVNDFLPLAATGEIVVGLFVGIAVHELAHALLARVEDVDVDSMGVILLTVVPFGAYVDMDGEEETATTAGQNRIYAAGVTVNLVVAIGCALLLMALVASSVAAVPGLAVGSVLPGTPADEAGIERGDVLTGVDGVEIDDEDALEAALADANGPVTVSRDDGESVTVEQSVVVTGGPEDGPNAIEPGATIAAVNGTAVATESAFAAELAAESDRDRDDPAVPVTVIDERGAERSETIVPGAFVTSVVEDGPLAAAGGPSGESGVVTRIGDERLDTHEALLGVLGEKRAGQTVTVGLYTTDGYEEYDVTLDANPNGEGARLGVTPQAGIGGLTITDFGVGTYPAEDHLTVLGGSESDAISVTNTPIDRLLGVSFLPFAGMIGLFTENFGGFVGSVANFYTVTGPLSILGGGVLLAATVLFWTGWFNLLIGFFNCLPAYPLDGGRLIQTNAEAIARRQSLSDPARIGTLVAGAATLVAVISVLLVLFGPMLLGS